jgi:hypothetical protein
MSSANRLGGDAIAIRRPFHRAVPGPDPVRNETLDEMIFFSLEKADFSRTMHQEQTAGEGHCAGPPTVPFKLGASAKLKMPPLPSRKGTESSKRTTSNRGRRV